MHNFSITVDSPENRFAPGSTISGNFTWDLSESSEYLTFQMFWYTEGKGTRDYAIIEEIKIDHPKISGEELFSFRIPSKPRSFSGTLISLKWALELKPANEKEAQQYEFSVVSAGEIVSLSPVEDPRQSGKMLNRLRSRQ